MAMMTMIHASTPTIQQCFEPSMLAESLMMPLQQSAVENDDDEIDLDDTNMHIVPTQVIRQQE